jgi:hypothetical protein
LVLKKRFWVGLVLVASLASARSSVADELLRVEGQAVKWAPAVLGSASVITYATLTRPFSIPDTQKTLSPDNCGTMGAFDDIVAASTQLTEAAAKEELRSAFASWERTAGVKFVEVSDVQRANIIVGAIVTSNGPAFANLSLEGGLSKQPVAKAVGLGHDNTDPGKSAARIEQAYVCLNPKQRWKIGFNGNLGAYDLRHTFMHEIGHAIGLDHPGSSGVIMGYRYDEQVRELQLPDIAAAQLLYGPARVTNSLTAPHLKP